MPTYIAIKMTSSGALENTLSAKLVFAVKTILQGHFRSTLSWLEKVNSKLIAVESCVIHKEALSRTSELRLLILTALALRQSEMSVETR